MRLRNSRKADAKPTNPDVKAKAGSDPGGYNAFWLDPWTGEVPLRQTKDQIYEYACHEGNYALPGILAGAREQEKAANK